MAAYSKNVARLDSRALHIVCMYIHAMQRIECPATCKKTARSFVGLSFGQRYGIKIDSVYCVNDKTPSTSELNLGCVKAPYINVTDCRLRRGGGSSIPGLERDTWVKKPVFSFLASCKQVGFIFTYGFKKLFIKQL